MNQLRLQFSRSFAISRVLKDIDPTEAELKAYLKKMPKYKKVRENMKRFQKDDGVPIHLKGGFLDKLTLFTINTGIIAGFVYFQYWLAETYWITPAWYSDNQDE